MRKIIMIELTSILPELKELDKIFPNIPLCAIGENKIPLGADWQRKPFTPKALADLLEADNLILPTKNGLRKFTAKGYGILTGHEFLHNEAKYKILAVDCDGQAAIDLLERMTGAYQLPSTVSWTSGKEGRYQLGFLVPEENWHRIKTIKFDTGEVCFDEREQKYKPILLEFRFAGLQSVFPPSKHPDTGSYKWINSPFDTEFALFPEWGYKMLEIESAEVREQHTNNTKYNQRWTDRDWAKSYLEAINLSALDWFDYRNVLFALHSLGYSEGEALAVSQTSSKHTEQGFYQIWNHIKDDKSRNVGIGTLGHLAKQHNWVNPFPKESSKNLSKKNKEIKEKEQDYNKIKNEVRRLVESNLPEYKVTIALKRIADSSTFNLNELKNLRREIEEQIESNEEKKIASSEFELNNERRKLDINLYDIFPKALAQAFYAQADKDRTDPLRFPHHFWSAAGSLWGSKVEIRLEDDLKGRSEWSEYPIFFTADIDNPSGGKSRTINKIFKKIKQLQKDEEWRYLQAKERFEEVKEAWDNMTQDQKDENRENPEVNPKLYKKVYLNPEIWLIDNATPEAAMKALSNQKLTKGIVWNQDELAGLFKGMDQYKEGGKGNSRQKLLEAWNGLLENSYLRGDIRSDDNKSYYLNGQTMSVNGGMQVKLFNKYFDLKNDTDGLVSRMLFLNPREHPKYAEICRKKVDIQSPLETYFNYANSYDCDYYDDGKPIRRIARFTSEAQEFFWHTIERYRRTQQRNNAENPSYSAYLGKLCSYIGRFAFVIHSVWSVFEYKELLEIDLKSVKAAVEYCDFYANQFLILQGCTDKTTESKLDGLLRDIWELVKTVGQYGTREIVRKFGGRKINGQRLNAKLAFDVLQELAKLGYGRLEGKTLYFEAPKLEEKEVEKEPVEQVRVKEKETEIAPLEKEREKIGAEVQILKQAEELTAEQIIIPEVLPEESEIIPIFSRGIIREISEQIVGKTKRIIYSVLTLLEGLPCEIQLKSREIVINQ